MESMVSLFMRRDYEALPEGFPAQLIDGCLVKEPAPTYDHQRIENRILRRLVDIVGEDFAIPAPTDVLIDEVNVYQPDIVVLREAPAGSDHYVGVPLLVVEVLSPSSRVRDRELKARRLIGIGVAEVWLVDPQKRVIEVVGANAYQRAEVDQTARSQALPAFHLVPIELFTPPRRPPPPTSDPGRHAGSREG